MLLWTFLASSTFGLDGAGASGALARARAFCLAFLRLALRPNGVGDVCNGGQFAPACTPVVEGGEVGDTEELDDSALLLLWDNPYWHFVHLNLWT